MNAQVTRDSDAVAKAKTAQPRADRPAAWCATGAVLSLNTSTTPEVFAVHQTPTGVNNVHGQYT
ncbi:hypothetical protein [Spirillospora sp. NPDC047279]|uniref:hypothetical protein n=1 Tax=Spirillospora sp. NPDC047279 TaxID=3155478 RepID=UPI00340D6C9F